MNGFLGALSVLTRVPVRTDARASGVPASWVPWFPVVGACVGLVIALVYTAARWLVPPLAAAGLATAAGALVTGAFHEDGLADLADAFGGGRDRDEALRILEDPRLGTYGVVAVVLAVMLRVGAVSALDPRSAMAALPAAHALSRAASAGLLRLMAPATAGLGATYASSVTGPQVAGALAAGAALGAAALGPWIVPALAVAAIGPLVVGGLATRKIRGLSGDVLGAAQQVSELACLLAAAALAERGGDGLPWWR
jgi:adenosylcobinamide-GDP ribazoletransferase